MTPVRRWLCCLLSSSIAWPACADSSADPPQPPAATACAGSAHRQFDFWLGTWDVTGPKGGHLGTNAITRSETGCWIVERWRGAGNVTGTSLNAWDASSARWRQFWVGSDGTVLRLEGGLRGEAMVMEGELPAPGGGRQRQRISWTPQRDGSVSQHWETSDDEGRSWATAFLGIYRRGAGVAP